ncbi:alpha/beta fold hydrolase [Streptomyces glaucescens]|uniref:Hydrolase n=1 Tax=Streptomyces glaucescens TaxID=1907 RepID=A0A089X9M6_STRGA|nr:alpha/beta hydrolase [Streptomyces glaucescens]AIR98596.1 hydrolase [Streptomyces glaucescens]
MPSLTTPDGTHLAYRVHTPPGPPSGRPPLLLLHGLAGHMGEWDALRAPLLRDGHTVIEYDARGHGASTRRPPTMTRAACVADAATLITALGLAPATLIGQSLGGHTAFLTAASHPGLVASLVLIEAGPGGPNPGLPAELSTWLRSWPLPFASLSSAESFLGHEAWARGLEQREDGWHPRFDADRMTAAVAELATHSYWAQWSRITCPTLAVCGAHGTIPDTEFEQMRTHRPTTHTAVIPNAGHDVHLDQPEGLYEVISGFLDVK